MLYTKTILSGGRSVRIELTDKNVFTTCSECGCELPLALTDGFTADVLCSCCEVKMEKLSVDAHPTYDGIAWLVGILARSGFAAEVLGLYDQYDIDDLSDLPPCEYTEFGNALARIFTDV